MENAVRFTLGLLLSSIVMWSLLRHMERIKGIASGKEDIHGNPLRGD